MDPKKFGQKEFGSKTLRVQKSFESKKKLSAKKIRVQTIFGSKPFFILFVPKNFGSKIFLDPKSFWAKETF